MTSATGPHLHTPASPMRILPIAVLLLAAPATLAAQTLDTVAIRKSLARFDNTASPGCAIAISRSGHLLYRYAAGMADLEHDVPITAGTIFEASAATPTPPARLSRAETPPPMER